MKHLRICPICGKDFMGKTKAAINCSPKCCHIGYVEKNREHVKEYQKEWRDKNREYVNTYHRNHYAILMGSITPDLKTGWSKKVFEEMYPTYDIYKRDYYNNPNHARWASNICKRDKYKCKDCGEHGDEADHLKNIYYHPEIALAMRNGECVCMKCHAKRTKRRLDNWKARQALYKRKL